jgi:hypothetical protein
MKCNFLNVILKIREQQLETGSKQKRWTRDMNKRGTHKKVKGGRNQKGKNGVCIIKVERRYQSK